MQNTKKIHFLGVCGTFMAGLAVLAKELGYEQLSGADQAFYPPMSHQLEKLDLKLIQGFDSEQLSELDLLSETSEIIIGNIMRRGLPVIETLLTQKKNLISGPAWLAEQVLKNRWVLAVSGTHGKTSTASMLAWILDYAGLKPGFLIGGIPENFGVSARLGSGRYFVVEADEYDSAFFDKRSKFLHYRPETLIINNLEFDHSDIFEDLAAIQKQFSHLLRVIPSNGLVITNGDDAALEQVLSKGLWTPCVKFGLSRARGDWHVSSTGIVSYKGEPIEKIDWQLLGQHNFLNALAAIIAANHIGVLPKTAIQALGHFVGVKRRLELKAEIKTDSQEFSPARILVFDDFAHHPTAMYWTLKTLRDQYPDAYVIGVIDIGSNTMKSGNHQAELADKLLFAHEVYFYSRQALAWSPESILARLKANSESFVTQGNVFVGSSEEVLTRLHEQLLARVAFLFESTSSELNQTELYSKPKKIIFVFMSNSDFSAQSSVLVDKLNHSACVYDYA